LILRDPARLGVLVVAAALIAPLSVDADDQASPDRIETNRSFDVLIAPLDDARELLRQGASELGDWSIELAGIRIDASALRAIADSEDPELVRATREQLGRPIDLPDFLYFLDDVLRAGRAGLRGREVVVPSGRARAAGILLHPQEIFEGLPRAYGAAGALAIDRPLAPRSYPPALDGEPLGPRWTARYPNPETEEEMLATLRSARPHAALADRIVSLLEQLRAQGAEVALTSTVRRRERGYLMWGAFLLSRARSEAQVSQVRSRLERARKEWALDIPIHWTPFADWRASVEAAREMADTYEVVYATEEGARASNHYTGVAVDMVALRLPARLTLRAPDMSERKFDLSAPEESRDLSLSPELIAWIEERFEVRKLTSDYPHWDDARASDP